MNPLCAWVDHVEDGNGHIRFILLFPLLLYMFKTSLIKNQIRARIVNENFHEQTMNKQYTEWYV